MKDNKKNKETSIKCEIREACFPKLRINRSSIKDHTDNNGVNRSILNLIIEKYYIYIVLFIMIILMSIFDRDFFQLAILQML